MHERRRRADYERGRSHKDRGEGENTDPIVSFFLRIYHLLFTAAVRCRNFAIPRRPSIFDERDFEIQKTAVLAVLRATTSITRPPSKHPSKPTKVSKKVDPGCILSAPTLGDFKKRFYTLVVKDGHVSAAPGDALTAPLLRLHFSIFDAIAIHNAKGVGLGAAFVSYTDADVLNWSTTGNDASIPELIERIEDATTMLVQMRVRMPNTSPPIS